MAKIRGVEITEDWSQAKRTGQIMAHVRVKRWYVPFLMLKGLKQSSIPRRYWPLLYWRYYIQRKYRHG